MNGLEMEPCILPFNPVAHSVRDDESVPHTSWSAFVTADVVTIAHGCVVGLPALTISASAGDEPVAYSYSSLDRFSGLLVKLQQLCLRWDRELQKLTYCHYAKQLSARGPMFVRRHRMNTIRACVVLAGRGVPI